MALYKPLLGVELNIISLGVATLFSEHKFTPLFAEFRILLVTNNHLKNEFFFPWLNV